MKAILFGSIGSLLETSEIQRAAFNEAFQEYGLDWHWSRSDYADLIRQSGGRRRIAQYAESKRQAVDADAIHQAKSKRFRQRMNDGVLCPRNTVEDVITRAMTENVRLAMVTTTSKENVTAVLDALSDPCRDAFDVIVCRDDVDQAKPSGEAYEVALQRLQLRGSDCLAIEDNVDGVRAASNAIIQCVAFPGQNTIGHDFDGAVMVTDQLDFDQLHSISHAIV